MKYTSCGPDDTVIHKLIMEINDVNDKGAKKGINGYAEPITITSETGRAAAILISPEMYEDYHVMSILLDDEINSE